MITEKEVHEVASRFLEGHEFTVRRSNGGWPTPCGWEVRITDDVPGVVTRVFVRDQNDMLTLQSTMIRFAESALTE